MMLPETGSSHALQSQPSLVLVAPMPRRPIALVARRHHHNHHHHHSSRSRSSRTVSKAHSPDSSSKDSAAQRSVNSPESQSAAGSSASTVRLVGHPYSRAKTPSNANTISNPVSPAAAALASANAWPLGLGISPVSPPPRSSAASREGIASRPLSRLSSREGATTLASTMQAVAVSCSPSFAQIFDTQTPVAPDTSSADEPMLASPIASSAEASTMSIMDVERTPTKRNARAQPNGKLITSYIQPRSHAAADDDQEPRSTPTIGATSPRPDDDHGLTLSPTSPSQQRITATAPASAQLPLSLSSPPAPSPIDVAAAQNKADIPDRITGPSASLAPSPCLSESHSRSPTASPSPCPSPSSGTLPDLPKLDQDVQQHRKPALPLPPVPTSPIPRKMTRNPFERYITARDGSSCSRSMTLHARLALAMAQSGRHGHLTIDGEDANEEMGISSPTMHRPPFISLNSDASAARGMDMVD